MHSAPIMLSALTHLWSSPLSSSFHSRSQNVCCVLLFHPMQGAMHRRWCILYFRQQRKIRFCLFSRPITVKEVMKTNANHSFTEPRVSLFACFVKARVRRPEIVSILFWETSRKCSNLLNLLSEAEKRLQHFCRRKTTTNIVSIDRNNTSVSNMASSCLFLNADIVYFIFHCQTLMGYCDSDCFTGSWAIHGIVLQFEAQCKAPKNSIS